MNLAWHLLLDLPVPEFKPSEEQIGQARDSIRRLKGKIKWYEVGEGVELNNAEKLLKLIK